MALLALLGVAETRLVTGTVAASLVFRPAGVKCSYPSFFNLQLVSLHFRCEAAHFRFALQDFRLMVLIFGLFLINSGPSLIRSGNLDKKEES